MDAAVGNIREIATRNAYRIIIRVLCSLPAIACTDAIVSAQANDEFSNSQCAYITSQTFIQNVSVWGHPELRATSNSRRSSRLRQVDLKSHALVAGKNTCSTHAVQYEKISHGTEKQGRDFVVKLQAEIAGIVYTADGQPVASVRVLGVAGNTKRETLSDSQGRFILTGFTAGAHVSVWAETVSKIRAEKVVVVPQSDLVLALPRTESVRGQVEEADTQNPIREFRIRIGDLPERSFRSDYGNFEWYDVQPGRLHVTAKAAGYQTQEIDTIIGSTEEPAPPLILRLQRGTELVGRVLDDETSTPVSGVELTYHDLHEAALPNHTQDVRITDSEGNFILDGLPPGEIEITATSSSYSEAKQIVRVGKQDFIEIRLRKPSSVSGYVLAARSNVFVPGARVSISDAERGSTWMTSADNLGFFYFGDLSPGHFVLQADAVAGRAQPAEVVLGVEQHIDGITLVVAPGATIRGRVTGLTDSELQVVDVTVRCASGFVATASTDLDGSYMIMGVPTGPIQLQAQTSNNRLISKTLDLPDRGQELTVDFEFPLSGHLHGHISRSGQVVAFEPVAAFPAEPGLATWVGETDRDGAYSAEGLSQGDYVIRVVGAQQKFVHVSRDTLLDIELR